MKSNPKYFQLSETPVLFARRAYIKIEAPEGLRDMLVPANSQGKATPEDYAVATWMCNALNHAKQRTEDVMKDLDLGGD